MYRNQTFGNFWFGRESKISADSAELTWPSKSEYNIYIYIYIYIYKYKYKSDVGNTSQSTPQATDQ